jgi:hypothetical protein
MEEMSSILYCKEVDITVDHIGKLKEEKPVLRKLQGFGKANLELEKARASLRAVGTWRRTIESSHGSKREAKSEEGEGDEGDQERGDKSMVDVAKREIKKQTHPKTEKLIAG